MVNSSSPNSSSLVGIAGKTGSGKTVLAERLKTELETGVVSFGAFVRAEAVLKGMSLNRATLQQLGEQLIGELGPEEFVGRVIQFHLSDGSADHRPACLIIEGVRHVEIWEVLQAQFANCFLVYLNIPYELRLRRIRERDNIDTESAIEILHHPLETAVEELLSSADLILEQDPPESLVRIVRESIERKGIWPV